MIDGRIVDFTPDFSKNLTPDQICQSLVQLKQAQKALPYYDKKFGDAIKTVVKTSLQGKEKKFIGIYGAKLNSSPSGREIIMETPDFQSYTTSLFNTQTSTQKIAWVLERLDGHDINKDKLREKYDEFKALYEDLVQTAISQNATAETFVTKTILLLDEEVKDDDDEIIWEKFVKVIPKLLANIFAFWTIHVSGNFIKESMRDSKEDKQEIRNYLFQPHGAQIIGLLRIFGSGDKTECLQNNLVQILTGEGKSVALAVGSTVFALVGFKVSCVCYSEYLSNRDYESFKAMFEAFKLVDKIKYGTINQLCERVINSNGDIRNTVSEWIMNNKKPSLQDGIKKEKQILIIDEVDVFFNTDFYGNILRIGTKLMSAEITNLVKFIWANRNNNLNWNSNLIASSSQYQALINKYPEWRMIFEYAAKNMACSVKKFDEPKYHIKDGLIAYQDLDQLSTKVNYGYKTVFAYFEAFEKGQISEEKFKENVYINLVCGDFSYAEIAKSFDYIVGVTGTLKSLNTTQLVIINKVFKINKFTYLPSVYGDSRLNWEKTGKPTTVVKEYDFHNSIEEEMKSRLIGSDGGKRAVIIVFETIKDLEAFRDQFKSKYNMEILTEAASQDEKKRFVSQASSQGKISLMTKVFGRGTDFICTDDLVLANGGVHVIQTFVSENESEEVQIRGRTARQGQKGSYSMVLADKPLEKYLIADEEIKLAERNYKVYETINLRRNALYDTLYANNIKFADEIIPKHKESLQFISNLLSEKLKEAQKYINDHNEFNYTSKETKVLVLMDGTGSMSGVIKNTKNAVQKMFDRIYNILKDPEIIKQYSTGDLSLELQFAVYRNYNAPVEHLLQVSPWEKEPGNLRKFIQTVNADYGLGNEAVEVGFWHACDQHKKNGVDLILLIGDVPPNTEVEITQRRQSYYGVNYWNSNFVKNVKHYSAHLQEIRNAGIPVYAFYVNHYAQTAFASIGISSFLDVNNQEIGEKVLTDVTTKVILEKMGGANGAKLSKEYETRFEKTYSA